MIIYGSKGKEIAKELQIEKCANCGQLSSVELHVYRRYAHVFWIPFFPLRKVGYSQCTHCKQVLEEKQMPEPLRQAYDNLEKQSKTPVWMFSGLALVAVLISIGVISAKQQDARNAKWILDPRKGDVYEVRNNFNSYTLYKVEEVVKDTVYVQFSMYETNKSSGLRDLKSKEYSLEAMPFSKQELKTLLDKGEIMDIER
jgi:hypothetical protein